MNKVEWKSIEQEMPKVSASYLVSNGKRIWIGYIHKDFNKNLIDYNYRKMIYWAKVPFPGQKKCVYFYNKFCKMWCCETGRQLECSTCTMNKGCGYCERQYKCNIDKYFDDNTTIKWNDFKYITPKNSGMYLVSTGKIIAIKFLKNGIPVNSDCLLYWAELPELPEIE